MRTSCLLLIPGLLFAACEDIDLAGDASVPDVSLSRPDAGDAGVNDAAAADAAPVDAEPRPDATTNDPKLYTFSASGHERLFGAAFDRDGNLVAVGVGSTTTIAPDLETIVVRIRPDGTLDPSFGAAGVFRTNLVRGGAGEVARGVVIQSSGRIVVSASVERAGAADARDTDVALVGVSSRGALDPSFGTEGVITHDLSTGAAQGAQFVGDAPWGLALGPDDTLVLEGSRKSPTRADSDFVVARFSANGAMDPGFGVGGLFELDIANQGASARSPAVLADGSVIGTGYMSAEGLVTPVLFKLTPGGVLDERFASRGVFNTAVLAAVTEAYGVGVESSGALIAAGYGRQAAMGTNDFLALRFSPTGVLDTGYGERGAAVVDIGGFGDNCRDLLVLPDDRAVLVGNGRPTANNNDAVIVVLRPNGTPDTSFGPGGRRSYELGSPGDGFWDVARAPDGRLGIVGVRGPTAAGGHDDAVVLLLPPF